MEAPIPTTPRPDWKLWAPLLLMALGACLLAAWATAPSGPGVCPDGRTYLTSARLLSQGQGYVDYPRGDDWLDPEPVTQFPPLYPLLLAAGHGVGLQGPEGARMLQLALLLANICLLGWFTASALASRAAGWMAAGLFASAPAFLYVHLWVWSEPLCTLLLLGCLLGLGQLEQGCRRAWLWAALCCALALLTRFAALSMLLAGCGLLLVGQGSLRARLFRSAVFGAIGTLVFAAWLLRNSLVAGEATAFELHTALMPEELPQALHTIGQWALPLPVWFGFKLATAALLFGWLAAAFRHAARTPAEQRTPGQRLAVMGGTLALTHFMFVLAARRVVGTALELNDRILGPSLLGLILLAVGATPPRWRPVGALLALLWLAGSIMLAASVRSEGLAYLGANWR